MSTRMTNLRRTGGDHFEPEDAGDGKAQRHLRGHLEQIDYTAFEANKKVMGGALGLVEARHFQRLSLGVAQARARWVATAIAVSESGRPASHEQVAELSHLRAAYEEQAAAYDALRRMVERGYVAYGPAAT